MSQHRELAKLVKDHDDPGRPSLIPGLPDLMGYVLTFLVCWGVYTIVVKTFSLIEEKKQEVKSAAMAERALAELPTIEHQTVEQRAEMAKKVNLGLTQKFEKTRDEIEHRSPKLGKTFDGIGEAIRELFGTKRRTPSENRF